MNVYMMLKEHELKVYIGYQCETKCYKASSRVLWPQFAVVAKYTTSSHVVGDFAYIVNAQSLFFSFPLSFCRALILSFMVSQRDRCFSPRKCG